MSPYFGLLSPDFGLLFEVAYFGVKVHNLDSKVQILDQSVHILDFWVHILDFLQKLGAKTFFPIDFTKSPRFGLQSPYFGLHSPYFGLIGIKNYTKTNGWSIFRGRFCPNLDHPAILVKILSFLQLHRG